MGSLREKAIVPANRGIEREDAWMSVLAYSSDGETLEDSGFAIPGDLPIDAEVFLVVGSLGDAGASAQFRNFVVVPK